MNTRPDNAWSRYRRLGYRVRIYAPVAQAWGWEVFAPRMKTAAIFDLAPSLEEAQARANAWIGQAIIARRQHVAS